MKQQQVLLIGFLALLLAGVPAVTVQAGNDAGCASCDDQPMGGCPACVEHLSYSDGVMRKLGRGLTNIVTCPLELIRQPYLQSQQDGALGGTMIGLVKGIGWTVARGAAGLYDTITFPVEIPKGFRSPIHPEFVYAHGDWTTADR